MNGEIEDMIERHTNKEPYNECNNPYCPYGTERTMPTENLLVLADEIHDYSVKQTRAVLDKIIQVLAGEEFTMTNKQVIDLLKSYR